MIFDTSARRQMYLATTILFGSVASFGTAMAQDTKGGAAAAEATAPSMDIVVTGTSRAKSRFDVSYSVSSLDQADVAKRAPLNMADLIGQLPGFQTEATGGEAQNIYRLRGLPGDSTGVVFLQDGLKVFQDNIGYFWAGDTALKFDLMTERMEVVRGGPSPIFASNAGAMLNQITVTGGHTPRGKAQLTLGDTGLYRLDAMQSGPLGADTYYAIGGFMRYHDGYRDNGFPSDKGGQIRANIKHDFENGSVKFHVNYVNDKNVFYLPIPVADPRNPSVSLDRYIDYFTGTMNSPALRNVQLQYRDGAGKVQSRNADLADGREFRMINFGLGYEGTVGDWGISAKASHTQGKLDFAAFYSTTNPADGNAFANGYLTAARSAFGSNVASMGYVLAGTNTVYDPYAQSGLVMQGQFRDIHSKFYSTQGDLSVSRRFDTGLGRHDLKLGLYASVYGETKDVIYNNYLIEIQGQPRLLDLVAYSASGSTLGRVTDKGVLNYTTTLQLGKSDATMFAVYGNDTWEVVPGLTVDAGIRYEKYQYSGWAAATEQVNLGDATTLADNTTRGYTGVIVNRKYDTQSVNWTAGVKYDVSRSIGFYGRISRLDQPFGFRNASSETEPVNRATKVNQFEAGLKLRSGGSHLYLTGFYSDFTPLNSSFVAYNPATGRNDQSVPFIGEAQIKGLELDGRFGVTNWFSLEGAFTVQDPKYKNFENSDGADPSRAEGRQIVREPKVLGNVSATFDLRSGSTDISIYGRYSYVGKRYVDLYNETAMPAYNTFGAGVTVKNGGWQMQVVGDNLFNNRGLTEGNTRTDLLSGQGSAEAIYGRPLFGRNFRLVVSRSW